jgi:competence protein ComEC
LLYDAGPAFGAEADSGAQVIVPYLRPAGRARLDLVVLSNQDNDPSAVRSP